MKIYVLAAAIAISIFVTGCSPILFLEIVNDAGADLAISTFDTAGKERHYNVPKDGKVRIILPKTMVIRKDVTDWRYEVYPAPIQKEYVKEESTGHLIERLQIQENGTIFCVDPDSGPLAKLTSPQPKWYPLIPVTSPSIVGAPN
jgi:hypothetical protein